MKTGSITMPVSTKQGLPKMILKNALDRLAYELVYRMFAMVLKRFSQPSRRGALLIDVAHELKLACAVFTPDQLDGTRTHKVENAMIEAGWERIEFGY